MRIALAGLGIATALLLQACGGAAADGSDPAVDFGGTGDEGSPDAAETIGDAALPYDAVGGEQGAGGGDEAGPGGDTGHDLAADPGQGDTDDPDAAGDTGGEESPFFDSPELFVKIVKPSSDHFAASGGSLIGLTGFLFGSADKITWSVDGKDAPLAGGIVPERFWLSDAIPLEPGDNVIRVTASKGERTATDWILVTYTPGFLSNGQPRARPDVVFVNEPTDVVFTIRVGDMGDSGDLDVNLHQADAGDFSPVKTVGSMVDDGDVWSSGDEVAKDGIYTWRGKVKCTAEGPSWYRVGIPVKTGVSSYVAYSAPLAIECVAHLTQSDCQAAVATQKAAWELWLEKKGAGEEAARDAVRDYLKGSAAVADAGREQDGYGVWARYKSGVLGALSLAPAGLRAGAGAVTGAAVLGQQEIASKKTVVLAPFASEFGADDETTGIAAMMKAKECPTYDVSGPHLGAQSTLARLRDGMLAGVLAIATHGDTFFGSMPAIEKEALGWSHTGSQEGLFIGDSFACGQLLASAKSCSGPESCPAGTECVITEAQDTYLSGVCVDRTQADLKRGRVALGNGNLVVLPAFVERYGKSSMPDSLVYLGACRTAYNGSLAGAFLAAGARTVAAYTDYVSSAFAGQAGREFFSALIDQERVTGSAVPESTEDPDHEGAGFVLIGAGELSLTASHIVNQGFERGDLTAWTADGDGRVISKLGATKPVSGKFMGIISTGLGFTVQTGSIEQTFCIPSDTYGLSFYWKYYSEEFHEFCGSTYQDTFQARMYTPGGQEMQIVDVAIDDLCDPDDCSGCCAKAQCVGLVPSDVQFDQGDTHMVPKWQKAKVDISGFAGKGPVTLSFFATDKGDSIYDTVIVVDSITFK